MKSNIKLYLEDTMSKTTGLTGTVTRVHLAAVALIAMIAATAPTHALADTLYVGDTSDNSIKAFCAQPLKKVKISRL
jgi:hypothetical protein